jgi:hypothetical protein
MATRRQSELYDSSSVAAATAARSSAASDGAFGDGPKVRLAKPGEVAGGHRGMSEFSSFVRGDGGTTSTADEAYGQDKPGDVFAPSLCDVREDERLD